MSEVDRRHRLPSSVVLPCPLAKMFTYWKREQTTMPIHSVRAYTNTDNTSRTKTPQGRYIYRNTSAEGIGPTTQAKHWAGGPGWRSGAALHRDDNSKTQRRNRKNRKNTSANDMPSQPYWKRGHQRRCPRALQRATRGRTSDWQFRRLLQGCH